MPLSLIALALLTAQALAAPRWAAIQVGPSSGLVGDLLGAGVRAHGSVGVPWVIEVRADDLFAVRFWDAVRGAAAYPRWTVAWPMSLSQDRLTLAPYARGGVLAALRTDCCGDSAVVLHRGGGLYARWGGHQHGDLAFEAGAGILQSTDENWEGYPIPEGWLTLRTRRGLTFGADLSTVALLTEVGVEWGWSDARAGD